MKYIVEFTDENDKQAKITANNDKVLVEEQHLISGNFLIFGDNKSDTVRISELQADQDLIKKALDDVIIGGV